MPAGIALATIHFLLGGLILARRFWPLLVTVLLVLAIVTAVPARAGHQLAVPEPHDPVQRQPAAHDRAPVRVRVSGRGTPALAALAAAGIPHVVHEYAMPEPAGGRGGRPHYGLDSAAALGVEPARIFKNSWRPSMAGWSSASCPSRASWISRRWPRRRAAGGADLARAGDGGGNGRAARWSAGASPARGHRRPMPVYLDRGAVVFAIYVSGRGRGARAAGRARARRPV